MREGTCMCMGRDVSCNISIARCSHCHAKDSAVLLKGKLFTVSRTSSLPCTYTAVAVPPHRM